MSSRDRARSFLGVIVRLGFLGVVLSATAATNPPSPSTEKKSAASGAPQQVELPPPPPMRYVPGLEEPLVATGGVTSEETNDLDRATAAYVAAPAKVGPSGDFADYAEPLLAFMKEHPASSWNAAILLNLGLGYYHAGYYSRTFACFDKAWQLGRNATSPQAKALADRSVGELAEMYARLGHATELEALFADLGSRPISGPAVQMLDGAREGLGAFHSRPEVAYLCGPAALRNILVSLKAGPEQIKIANDARSGRHGYSLEQLAQLAEKAGLNIISSTANQDNPCRCRRLSIGTCTISPPSSALRMGAIAFKIPPSAPTPGR